KKCTSLIPPSTYLLQTPLLKVPLYNTIEQPSLKMSARTAVVNRTTAETDIQLALSLDGGSLSFANFDVSDSDHATQTTGGQIVKVNSGIGFLDHMLHALAKHGGWSLELRCKGDLHSKLLWAYVSWAVLTLSIVDDHHTA